MVLGPFGPGSEHWNVMQSGIVKHVSETMEPTPHTPPPRSTHSHDMLQLRSLGDVSPGSVGSLEVLP